MLLLLLLMLLCAGSKDCMAAKKPELSSRQYLLQMGNSVRLRLKGGQSHTVENIKPGGCNGAEWKNKYKQLWNSMDYLHGQEQKNI